MYRHQQAVASVAQAFWPARQGESLAHRCPHARFAGTTDGASAYASAEGGTPLANRGGTVPATVRASRLGNEKGARNARVERGESRSMRFCQLDEVRIRGPRGMVTPLRKVTGRPVVWQKDMTVCEGA